MQITALEQAGAPERMGDRSVSRLTEVRAILADDLAWIEKELVAHAGRGLEPATHAACHLLRAGGKRVRPIAVLLSAACFGSVGTVARELAVVAELVHLATLLHDDVVDDGQERRGQTTARRVWGNAVSVLAGDLLLTHSLERTSAVAPGDTLRDLITTLRVLVDGEVVQLRGRSHVDITEETYFRIVRDKTASLFAWATRAGARSAGAPEHAVQGLGTFGLELGLAFQLVDDVLDYAGDPKETGKNLFADLREGKMTLPLILAIGRSPGLMKSVEALRAGDESAAQELVTAVHHSGACQQTRRWALDHTERALRALDVVPPSAPKTMLSHVATDMVARVS